MSKTYSNLTLVIALICWTILLVDSIVQTLKMVMGK